MQTDAERILKLETELKLIKWLIPAAAAFVLICCTIFFSVTTSNLKEKVNAAIESAALEPAKKRIADYETAAGKSASSASEFAATALAESNKIKTLLTDMNAGAFVRLNEAIALQSSADPSRYLNNHSRDGGVDGMGGTVVNAQPANPGKPKWTIVRP